MLYVCQQIGNFKKKEERQGNWPFSTENLRSTVLDETGLTWALPTERTSTAKCVKKGVAR